MTTFDVPARPEGGPAVRPPKPPPDVLIRHHNGNVTFITPHVRRLWDLLEEAVRYGQLDDDDLAAAIALGILAKFPVAHLLAEQRQRDQNRAEGARRRLEQEARRAWLAEPVEVLAAHPFKSETPGGPRPKPGSRVTVTRGYAMRLVDEGMAHRPPGLAAGDPSARR